MESSDEALSDYQKYMTLHLWQVVERCRRNQVEKGPLVRQGIIGLLVALAGFTTTLVLLSISAALG